jgi:hypothetical protein
MPFRLATDSGARSERHLKPVRHLARWNGCCLSVVLTWLLVLGLALAGCASTSQPVRFEPGRDLTPEQQAADRTACEAEAREEVAKTSRRPRGLYLLFGDDEAARSRAYRMCMEQRGYQAK